MTTGFRRIDIDSLHPQRFEDITDGSDESMTGPDEQKVRLMIGSGLLEDALRECLVSPPHRKEQEKRITAIRLVTEVLVSFKSTEIEKTVQKLSVAEGDLLMNYVYKAMEMDNEVAVSHVLLAWHSAIFARFGHGAVVRVLSERLIL